MENWCIYFNESKLLFTYIISVKYWNYQQLEDLTIRVFNKIKYPAFEFYKTMKFFSKKKHWVKCVSPYFLCKLIYSWNSYNFSTKIGIIKCQVRYRKKTMPLNLSELFLNQNVLCD